MNCINSFLAFLFLIFSAISPLLGQPVYSWGKILDLGQSFGKPFLKSDLVKIDNDTYVLGVTYSNQSLPIDDLSATAKGEFDVCLMTFDKDGKVKKVKSFGENQAEELGSIAANEHGEILLAINFESKEFLLGNNQYNNPEGTDVLLMKLSKELDLIWSRWIYSEADVVKGMVVKFDRMGNCYLGATFNSDGIFIGKDRFSNNGVSGSNDILIAKFDAKGESLWGKTFGGPYEDFVKDIVVDQNGHVFFGGQFHSSEIYFGNKRIASNGLKDTYLAELDQNGKFLNAYGFGSELNDDLRDIEIGENGNLYLAGHFQGKHFFLQDSLVATKSKGNDFFIASFSPNMNLNWVRSNGNLNSVVPYHIKLDEANNIYVHGRFDSPKLSIGETTCVNAGVYSSDIWISKWDTSGQLIWSKSYGGKDWEIEGGFIVEGEDSFILTGNTESETVQFGSHSLKKSTEIGQFLVRFDKHQKESNNGNLEEVDIEVFPSLVSNENPVVNIVIKNKKSTIGLLLQITDQSGNILLKKKIPSSKLEDNYSFLYLPSGVYHVTLSSASGIISTEKIVKY